MPIKTLDKNSMRQINLSHPLLKQLWLAIIADGETNFVILESLRGEAEQTRAYQQGFSKAKFGQSAHNYVPAVANDACPLVKGKPQFKEIEPFIHFFRGIVLPKAKKLNIPVRWLGDPDMNPNTNDGWDYPHLELHPWRNFAKGSKLYKGK